MKAVSSWGRLSAEPHHVFSARDLPALQQALRHSSNPGLAHGMGRSYGDACLNPGGTLWLTGGLDHFIAFNEDNGR